MNSLTSYYTILYAFFCLFLSVKGGPNQYQIQEMVFWHNKARSEIATAGLCSNMLEMQWDSVVAQVAIAYTEACAADGVLNSASPHNPNRGTQFGAVANAQEIAANCYGGDVAQCLGEDWAAGGGNCPNGGLCVDAGICGNGNAPPCESCTDMNFCTIKSMIYNSWYVGEKSGNDCKTFNNGGGHCTQVTWQNSINVGCGYFNCPNSAFGFYMTCDYGLAGNFNLDANGLPLHGDCIPGNACANCPSTQPHCTQGGLCSANVQPASAAAVASTAGGVVAVIIIIGLLAGGGFYAYRRGVRWSHVRGYIGTGVDRIRNNGKPLVSSKPTSPLRASPQGPVTYNNKNPITYNKFTPSSGAPNLPPKKPSHV